MSFLTVLIAPGLYEHKKFYFLGDMSNGVPYIRNLYVQNAGYLTIKSKRRSYKENQVNYLASLLSDSLTEE